MPHAHVAREHSAESMGLSQAAEQRGKALAGKT